MNRLKNLFSWRARLINEAEETAKRATQNEMESHTKNLAKIQKALQLKRRLIKVLREEPTWVVGNAIIMIRSENHKLAHDVAKELHIKLDKTAQGDGFNYKCNYNGTHIVVYGAREAVNCKITSHKETREITIYEQVCI